MQVVLAHVDVSPNVYEKVSFYADHCPRLWCMLQKGIRPPPKKQDPLVRPITVTKDETYYQRHYRYESFREDFALA